MELHKIKFAFDSSIRLDVAFAKEIVDVGRIEPKLLGGPVHADEHAVALVPHDSNAAVSADSDIGGGHRAVGPNTRNLCCGAIR